jgi:hypothetical protein
MALSPDRPFPVAAHEHQARDVSTYTIAPSRAMSLWICLTMLSMKPTSSDRE